MVGCAAAAAGLALEACLGELLAKQPTVLVRGQHGRITGRTDELPEGVTLDVSSHVQILAAAPKEWLDKVIVDVASGRARSRAAGGKARDGGAFLTVVRLDVHRVTRCAFAIMRPRENHRRRSGSSIRSRRARKRFSSLLTRTPV
jgi:hypothetical protein